MLCIARTKPANTDMFTLSESTVLLIIIFFKYANVKLSVKQY